MPYKNLDSSIVFEKPGTLSENLKPLTSSIFFAETSHMLSTYHCPKKGVWDFFILFGS